MKKLKYKFTSHEKNKLGFSHYKGQSFHPCSHLILGSGQLLVLFRGDLYHHALYVPMNAVHTYCITCFPFPISLCKLYMLGCSAYKYVVTSVVRRMLMSADLSEIRPSFYSWQHHLQRSKDQHARDISTSRLCLRRKLLVSHERHSC